MALRGGKKKIMYLKQGCHGQKILWLSTCTLGNISLIITVKMMCQWTISITRSFKKGRAALALNKKFQKYHLLITILSAISLFELLRLAKYKIQVGKY